MPATPETFRPADYVVIRPHRTVDIVTEKLEDGEYDWAHLAYSIWPERVKSICKTDRSIAIAHDLEHLCEVKVKKTKKKKSKKKSAG